MTENITTDHAVRFGSFLLPSIDPSTGKVFVDFLPFVPNNAVKATLVEDVSHVFTADAAATHVFKAVLTANSTLANPLHMVDGDTYLWVVTQDATGGWTLAYGSAFVWPAGTPPVVTAGANKKTVICGVVDGSSILVTSTLNY